jgi:PAS domain S-box-containing protein
MLISHSVLADAVLHTNSDAIVASDKDGIIRFWNPGAERIFGYTSVDAIGKSLDIIIPERLRARHWQGYRQVMATGRAGTARAMSLPFQGSERMELGSRSNSPSCRFGTRRAK